MDFSQILEALVWSGFGSVGIAWLVLVVTSVLAYVGSEII